MHKGGTGQYGPWWTAGRWRRFSGTVLLRWRAFFPCPTGVKKFLNFFLKKPLTNVSKCTII